MLLFGGVDAGVWRCDVVLLGGVVIGKCLEVLFNSEVWCSLLF